ncbi:MAG: phosphonate C-P lyase system protein PhnH [Gammaproteobacteria bacterium]|nr:phosphonate C-P lyase system protein PhnH [Gammaproteobacteria bacterium]
MNIESIWQAAVQQQVFRELVETFSRPGVVRDLTQWIGNATAHRAVLATLMDGEATLADPHGSIAAPDWRLLQAQRGAPETARYVAIDGSRTPDFRPALGRLESPEFGATLLIEIIAIGSGLLSLDLAGPGIDGQRELRLEGLHTDWLLHRADWVSGFPLGVDLLLCDATCIVALPRTTRIAIS